MRRSCYSCKFGVKGFFRVEKIRNGEVMFDSGWYDNIILNVGLDTIMNETKITPRNFKVGSDSTEPDPTQTDIFNLVADSTNVDYESSLSGGTLNVGGSTEDEPAHVTTTVTGEFKPGVFNDDTLAEMVNCYDSTRIVSRQLIRGQEDITDEVVGTGDGSTKQYAYQPQKYLVEENIIITATSGGSTLTVNDDGSGNLTGDVDSGGSNTVNYTTGEMDWTFSSAPDDGTNITIDYTWMAPTTITLSSVDGLKITYKIRVSFQGPIDTDWTWATGSFTLSTDSGDETINYHLRQNEWAHGPWDRDYAYNTIVGTYDKLWTHKLYHSSGSTQPTSIDNTEWLDAETNGAPSVVKGTIFSRYDNLPDGVDLEEVGLYINDDDNDPNQNTRAVLDDKITNIRDTEELKLDFEIALDRA